ncbi:MAG: TIGR04255 family protein [Acidimicrobiales bacterium]
MPGLDLPAPDTRRLERSPLELVVCQIRHERSSAATADATRAFAVRDGLEAEYPIDDEVTGLALNVVGGPSRVSTATDQQQGWNFKSADGAWIVVLMPDFFALESRAYTDWDDFSTRLGELVRQVEGVLAPGVERRVGLRFIDRITDPKITSPTGWEGWINERLLGPILHDNFGPAIKSLQQVLQLDGGDGMEVLLRHGCLVDDPPVNQVWHYLLDYDCSRSRGRAFSADDIRDTTECLHDLALSVFQASIEPKLYDHLRGNG